MILKILAILFLSITGIITLFTLVYVFARFAARGVIDEINSILKTEYKQKQNDNKKES